MALGASAGCVGRRARRRTRHNASGIADPNRVSRQAELQRGLSRSRTLEQTSSAVFQGFQYFRFLHDQVLGPIEFDE